MTANRGSSAAIYNATLEDLCHEFGDEWDITLIAGGYRASIHSGGGRTAVSLYGRTPAELAESIRMAENTR